VSEITVTMYTSTIRINLCLSVKIVRVKVMFFLKNKLKFCTKKKR
jgi:hypothetical protein